MKICFIILFIVFMAVGNSSLAAYIFEAKVIRIIDGDKIVVLNDQNQQIKVRLVEIDAPEKYQPFGNEAKKILSEMIFAERIKVIKEGKDKYNRMLDKIYFNEKSINEELVNKGAVFCYRSYLKNNDCLGREKIAQKNKIGLWRLQPDQRILPWIWRREHHY